MKKLLLVALVGFVGSAFGHCWRIAGGIYCHSFAKDKAVSPNFFATVANDIKTAVNQQGKDFNNLVNLVAATKANPLGPIAKFQK